MSTTEGLEAAVKAALAAAIAWQREAREALWRLPSHRQVEATIRAQYERAEAAEALLAEILETVATHRARYGPSLHPQADALAHAVEQIAGRVPKP